MAIVDIQVGAFVGQICFEDIFVTITVKIAGSHSHACLRQPICAVSRPRQQAHLLKRAVSLIDPEMSGGAVIGDVNVRPAVPVEIGANDPETGPDSRADSSRFGDIFKRSITAVVKQARRYRLVHLRRAIVPLTGGCIAVLVSLYCEIQIIRNKKVKAPVAVIVNPSRARAPARVINTSLRRHIGEGAVAIVVVKNVASEVCNVEVLEAVVIVVAHRNSHAVADVPDSGFFRDVHKLQLPSLAQKIAEEAVAGRPSRRERKLRAPRILRRIERRSLNHIHIQVAVVVVIEECYTGAHDFRHVVFACSTCKMVKLQPDFLGDFAEEWNLRRKAENGTGESACPTS